MYHNALFKRNADKAAAFVKPLQVRIGYAYALIFTHELTDGSCIGCDELNVAELIGAEQMVKHFKKIVILIDRERHGAELIKDYVSEDYLVMSTYAMTFGGVDAEGLPHLSSANSVLAEYPGYLLDYENPYGAGRISIL